MDCTIAIFYGITGILIGAIFALLFIRMDKSWKTGILTSVSLPSFLVILYPLNNYMKIDNDHPSFYWASSVYIVFLLATICIVMCITGYLIKRQTGVAKIRFLDILLGYNKCFEQYYKSREDEVKKDLNYDVLIALKKEQEDLKNLNIEKERILENQLQHAISISLPVNSKMPIDNKFLSCMPGYIANLSHFYHSIENNTQMFCDKYKKGEENDLDFVLGYFSSICMDINTKLFNNSSGNIRSHFRIKYKNNYVKFIAFQGGNKFFNDLTKIPVDSGLIKYSFENKCSLLKSENRSLHYKSKNDGYWKNYISFAVCDICEDDYPLLSIGISVNDEALYNDMLYFINFCKIERIISKCIAQFNNICDIYKVIESYCKEMENGEDVKQI